MTLKESYIKGFSKTAEASGVNPSDLARSILKKEAATDIIGKAINLMSKDVRPIGKSIGGKLSNFVSLLSGKQAAKSKDIVNYYKQQLKCIGNGAFRVDTGVRDSLRKMLRDSELALRQDKINTALARTGTIGGATALGLAAANNNKDNYGYDYYT